MIMQKLLVPVQFFAARAAGLISLDNGFLTFFMGENYKLTKQVCFSSSARMLLERCQM
jgi:hypothetical protein